MNDLPVGCTPTNNPPLTGSFPTPRWVPETLERTTTVSPSDDVNKLLPPVRERCVDVLDDAEDHLAPAFPTEVTRIGSERL